MTLTVRQSLDLWHETLMKGISDDAPDLSQRQLALLLRVYLSPGPHTVNKTADEMGIPRPAVSRAVVSLEKLGLITKTSLKGDKRGRQMAKTSTGHKYIISLGQTIQDIHHAKIRA